MFGAWGYLADWGEWWLWGRLLSKRLAKGSGHDDRGSRRVWVVNDYPDTSNDGLVYGHVVEISGDAPPDLGERLGGTSLNIGPIDADEE